MTALKYNLETFLIKAHELEEKYEWLQAKDIFKEAQKIAFNLNDFKKVSDLHYRIGFCFFKAGLQAKTKTQFRLRMNSSIHG